MQVTQTKVLSLIDNNSIGIRYVDSTLNNGGGNQHIIIIIDKTEDNLLQFHRLHLPMPDSNPAIRNTTENHRFEFREIGYTIIDQKNLPIAAHFKINGIGNHLFTERMHFRLYRIAVGRRSRNHT